MSLQHFFRCLQVLHWPQMRHAPWLLELALFTAQTRGEFDRQLGGDLQPLASRATPHRSIAAVHAAPSAPGGARRFSKMQTMCMVARLQSPARRVPSGRGPVAPCASLVWHERRATTSACLAENFEQTIQPARVDCNHGLLAHGGFGVVGHRQASHTHHRQVVRAVAHGNRLAG